MLLKSMDDEVSLVPVRDILTLLVSSLLMVTTETDATISTNLESSSPTF